jgi:hypothetical protein
MHASVPRCRGSHLKHASQSFPGCVQIDDGGCLRPRHGASVQSNTLSRGAPWRWVSPVLSRHCGPSQPSLLRRVLEAKPSSLLHKALEVSQFSPHYRSQEGNQSSHLHRAAQVNLCNSQTHISPRTGSWHSARLEPHLLPATGLPQLATECRRICTVEATTR